MNNNLIKLEIIEKNHKICKRCGVSKPIEEYYQRRGIVRCKICSRFLRKERYKNKDEKIKERQHFLRSYFKRAYGITLEQYNEMLVKQNGLCAICNTSRTRINHKSNKREQLAVDHCHKTGKVRGLLCGKCNLGIGSFNENIEWLENCVKYLKSHGQ